jgi:hypothetical protein
VRHPIARSSRIGRASGEQWPKAPCFFILFPFNLSLVEAAKGDMINGE